jgi:hypothetical protein
MPESSLTRAAAAVAVQVTNGFQAAYNYQRNSPTINLNDDRVSELAAATMTVCCVRWGVRPVAWIGVSAAASQLDGVCAAGERLSRRQATVKG